MIFNWQVHCSTRCGRAARRRHVQGAGHVSRDQLACVAITSGADRPSISCSSRHARTSSCSSSRHARTSRGSSSRHARTSRGSSSRQGGRTHAACPRAPSHYVCRSPSSTTAASTRASPTTTPTPQLRSTRETTFTTFVQAGASARKHLTRFTCASPTPGQLTHSFSKTAAHTLQRSLQEKYHRGHQVHTSTHTEQLQ
jgi:hypothetical protein